MIDIEGLLAADGPIASSIEGYAPRPSQQLMSQAVAAAMHDSELLVVEAGTGTGKTLAYLLPALLSGSRTIIATGTRALQDQLYHRDLPMLTRSLGRPVATALLKGRSNYLCLLRLDNALREHGALTGSEADVLTDWRDSTRTGDKAEVTAIHENAALWPLVTSTADNCHGQKCPFYDDCHVANARRDAASADLVVVNHHLLLADLAFREGGFVEFLPEADAIIIDEAHQLADIAVEFFGVSVSQRQFLELFDELEVQFTNLGGPKFVDAVIGARTGLRQLRMAIPDEARRYAPDQLPITMHQQLPELRNELAALIEQVEVLSDESEAGESLLDRLLRLTDKLAIASAANDEEGLRWLDVTPRNVRWYMTPLDVSARMRQAIDLTEASWVFTSATIAVGENFEHFTARLGLDEVRCLQFATPFDLAANARAVVPRGLPAAGSQGFIDALLNCVTPLLQANPGGTFILHTSYRALNQSADWFAARPELLDGRPLYVQGEAPRDQLLTQFRRDGNAVLLATGTFWEGVDVRGEALSLVIIDKLPFAAPDDPLLVARAEHLRARGQNPFMAHQLPEAVLALKQGVGRLLRDATDRGVIVLGDRRLYEKGYGRVFLSALAPIPVGDSIDEACTFLRHDMAPQRVAS
ncbi:MAG: ATP-dependent DNA helicase [Pseudomonadota bacterium]